MTQIARGTETILVVEDDDSLRRLIRLMLTSNGYTVLDAANGTLALEICDRHPGEIHLLLTDSVMPGISGPELSHQLLARRPGSKLLLMSGYSPRALDDRGLANADAAFLQKPFSSADLARAARTLLDQPEHPPLDRSKRFVRDSPSGVRTNHPRVNEIGMRLTHIARSRSTCRSTNASAKVRELRNSPGHVRGKVLAAAIRDLMTTLISYSGRIVATASGGRVNFTPPLDTADQNDPLRRFVYAMGFYAADVGSAQLEGPYTDWDAALYARTLLIADADFRRARGRQRRRARAPLQRAGRTDRAQARRSAMTIGQAQGLSAPRP